MNHVRSSVNGKRLFWFAAAFALSTIVLAACGSGASDSDKTQTAAAGRPPTSSATRAATTPAASGSIPSNVGKDDEAQLTGAGATFPNPLYTRWFSDYKS